jgi:hypothetical protein
LEVGSEVRVVLDRARHHVLARREEPAEVVERALVIVERRAERRVTHAVGVEGEDRVDVVGRDDTGVGAVDEPARVRPDLVGVVDAHADEVEVRPLEDRPERLATHVACAPLHDPVHGPSASHRLPQHLC